MIMWNFLCGLALLISVAIQLPVDRQQIIERILERNRDKDISELVAQGRVKVNLTGYEYNTTGGMISVNKKNNKTQIRINVDEGSGPVRAESFANVGGHVQEAALSNSDRKSIAKFYIDRLGQNQHGQDIPIERIQGGVVHIKNASLGDFGDKGIAVKYHKGNAFHLPDGRIARKHKLRIRILPHLLDKDFTRINVTVGEKIIGRQYLNVGGVNILLRDESEATKRCRLNPLCTVTRERFVSQRLRKPDRSWKMRIPNKSKERRKKKKYPPGSIGDLIVNNLIQ